VKNNINKKMMEKDERKKETDGIQKNKNISTSF